MHVINYELHAAQMLKAWDYVFIRFYTPILHTYENYSEIKAVLLDDKSMNVKVSSSSAMYDVL